MKERFPNSTNVVIFATSLRVPPETLSAPAFRGSELVQEREVTRPRANRSCRLPVASTFEADERYSSLLAVPFGKSKKTGQLPLLDELELPLPLPLLPPLDEVAVTFC